MQVKHNCEFCSSAFQSLVLASGERGVVWSRCAAEIPASEEKLWKPWRQQAEISQDVLWVSTSYIGQHGV